MQLLHPAGCLLQIYPDNEIGVGNGAVCMGLWKPCESSEQAYMRQKPYGGAMGHGNIRSCGLSSDVCVFVHLDIAVETEIFSANCVLVAGSVMP